MKEITRINHIGIRVKDMNVARHFYEQLGFKFIAGPLGPEPVAIMEHPSGININFILNANADCHENVLMDVPDKHTGYTHVALEVSSYEAALSEITTLGIEITGQVEFEGARFFFIRDPDKNVIEFHQPAND
ncbi:VOC family protein [Mangrovimicrobium sediminis]|uniref:VOC family protein n=1 Tax=Mangrovimicrobium sediminis TaxID=2562682 RepID=A0A4Z0M9Q1_9GAMM|nr:VOC family protein [Haliea sp. SAOS-164]TGD76239.1 VOC family protein [Haliea sp. SAOS-164]